MPNLATAERVTEPFMEHHSPEDQPAIWWQDSLPRTLSSLEGKEIGFLWNRYVFSTLTCFPCPSRFSLTHHHGDFTLHPVFLLFKNPTS